MRSQARSNVLHPHASGSTAFPVLIGRHSLSLVTAHLAHLVHLTRAVSTLRSRHTPLPASLPLSDFPAARQPRHLPGDTHPSGTTPAVATRDGLEDPTVNRNRTHSSAHRVLDAHPTSRMLVLCAALVAGPLLALHAPSAHAQAQTSAPAAAKLSNEQLDSLTAPVALYPDALLAQVLMASTYPSDVTAAASWSSSHTNMKGDDAVKAVASEPWDPSVQSLVAFPQVLATMASKPDWMTQLGNAFIAQPNDVMDSVQRLRRAAQSAGNLKSNEQQKVIVEQSTIQIQPTSTQVVYVPTYNPTVVYGTWPYPAYPPVYVPPPPGYAIASGFAAGIAFGAGIAVTNALWGGFNWNNHDVNVNVNRYNNINVNNRITANGGTTNWNRNNPQFNRNNVNASNRQNNLNTGNIGSGNRAQANQYRGRDDPRAQARQTLQTRTGQDVNGPASQRVQDIKQGGNRAGGGGGGLSGANRGDVQQRAQGVNRDNALRGAGDGDTARRDAQRGQASREQLANRGGGGGGMQHGGGGGGAMQHGGGGGGGFGAGGGGAQRGGGGGGVQRGGGGGGGGGFGGGGHGGGHGGGMHRR
jgi:hypothetical protein